MKKHRGNKVYTGDGEVKQAAMNRVFEYLRSREIECECNYEYFYRTNEGNRNRVNIDILGNDFIIRVCRISNWDWGLDELNYQNKIANCKYKILILYSIDMSEAVPLAFSEFKRLCKKHNASCIYACERHLKVLADTIIKKIPYSTF